MKANSPLMATESPLVGIRNVHVRLNRVFRRSGISVTPSQYLVLEALYADASTPVYKDKSAKPQEIAQGFLHTDESGRPAIPQTMLFAGIINAGRHHKLGKRSLTNAETSLVPGFIRVPGMFFRIQHEQPWTVDVRAIVNAAGSRSVAYRPIFMDWAVEFGMLVDEALGANLARELVDTLGARIGIGAYRLERKGPFGAFRVVNWEVERAAVAAE